MLEFHPVEEHAVAPRRRAALLMEFRDTLLDAGMASIEEYGDMLKWGLPQEDGVGRSFHVFHPGFCSYSDAFYGTIHYHGGWIRGTVLSGGLEHITYQATPDADGDRFLGDVAYTLTPHQRTHEAGRSYHLPAMVPHWVKPTGLAITLFEEEDNERMGDLVNPASGGPDDQPWIQGQAEALRPELLELIDAELEHLSVVA